MRNISIKWRMTLWFSLLMIAITALMLVFVMLMNRIFPCSLAFKAAS